MTQATVDVLESTMMSTTTNMPNWTDVTTKIGVFDYEATKRATELAAIIVPIFFSLIFVIGLTGNILVILVLVLFGRRSGNLNTTYKFILNLAISDFFFLIFCVPFQAPVYSLPYWPFGSFMCWFCEICQTTTMLASVYTLVALSFDRYFAVAHATSSTQIRTRGNTNRTLATIWILSIGIGVPSYLKRVYVGKENNLGIRTEIPFCVLNTEEPSKTYATILFVLGYALPFLIILSCYLGMLNSMRKSAKNTAVANSKNSNAYAKRVTKIVIMVVLFFLFDWFFYYFCSLWVFYGGFVPGPGSFFLKVFSHCLAYANSCVNPIIYAFVSKKFRDDFKKVFTCQYMSDTFGSMRNYSRNLVASVRHQFHPTAQGAKTEDGRNSEEKLREKYRPRTPVMKSANFTPALSSKDLSGPELTTTTVVSCLTPATTIKNNQGFWVETGSAASSNDAAGYFTRANLADGENGNEEGYCLIEPFDDSKYKNNGIKMKNLDCNNSTIVQPNAFVGHSRADDVTLLDNSTNKLSGEN